MRMTVALDDDLVAAAQRLTGTKDNSALLRQALHLIEDSALAGSGIGYVDAQLLAATRLTPDARLWTRDRPLAAVAGELAVAFEGSSP